MCSGSLAAKFLEKTSVKSEYLDEIELEILLAFAEAIWILQDKLRSKFLLMEAKWTAKALSFGSKAAIANFFF